MPKLKVYATRIGFHDAVVAAPNQKAALKAWDIGENLFAQGTAEVTDEPQAVKAALAAPGVVLRRPAGTRANFAEAPSQPAAPKSKGKAKAKAAKPPKPDRRALDRAEKALAAYDKDAERRREQLERGLKNGRLALERERDRLLRVYRLAGGE